MLFGNQNFVFAHFISTEFATNLDINVKQATQFQCELVRHKSLL